MNNQKHKNYEDIDKQLKTLSNYYLAVLEQMAQHLNLLPPSSAIAGCFAQTDNARGVWKAPANISLAGVIEPAFFISHSQQETLNMDITGLSINAIRSFPGQGTLIWGARTLDGNNLEWRYVNMVRTELMLTETIENALRYFSFNSNDQQTWISIKSTLDNYMLTLWKRGALVGQSGNRCFRS